MSCTPKAEEFATYVLESLRPFELEGEWEMAHIA